MYRFPSTNIHTIHRYIICTDLHQFIIFFNIQSKVIFSSEEEVSPEDVKMTECVFVISEKIVNLVGFECKHIFWLIVSPQINAANSILAESCIEILKQSFSNKTFTFLKQVKSHKPLGPLYTICE